MCRSNIKLLLFRSKSALVAMLMPLQRICTLYRHRINLNKKQTKNICVESEREEQWIWIRGVSGTESRTVLHMDAHKWERGMLQCSVDLKRPIRLHAQLQLQFADGVLKIKYVMKRLFLFISFECNNNALICSVPRMPVQHHNYLLFARS